MVNFKILLKKNLVEMVRNKRVIVFGLVFIALSLISALSARYLPMIFNALLESVEGVMGEQILMLDPTVADSYVQYISNYGQIAVLLVGIMFAGTITKEKTRGTYSNLKMNKVKDKEIVFSHLVAQVILVSLSYFISVAMFVILNILLFRQVMGIRGFVALTYIYLLLLITICFAMLCSCFCKKSSKAVLFVILGYFALSILEVLPRINKFNPLHLLTLSSNLMYYKDYSLNEHLISSLFTVGLCVCLVVLSLLLVKNRINNKKVTNSDNTERV